MSLLVSFALLASVLQAPAPTPELLPPLPAGWQHERIPFPLSFAPELGSRGFEELHFAPGMFDPKSESYFSYVLAMRFEEPRAFDERELADLFRDYYQGLCKAVGESRGLELDIDGIRATASFDGRDTIVAVRAFDAFGSGQELLLRLEVSVHVEPGATELLGLASPRPRDAPIWKELSTLREGWRAKRSAPAFLNHVYVVPDAVTYAALEASELLAELAVREVRTTVRTDFSYTGLYFYGEHTYFEFLAPSAAFPQGSTGIAFGFEQPGGARARAAELVAGGVSVETGPVTRELEGAQVPWFEMLSVAGASADSRLNLFALEYDPRFLASWRPGVAPAAGGITRRAVLERYAAVLDRERLRLTGPFRDVTRVELAVSPGERARLATVTRLLGYRVEERGADLVCAGPHVELVVRSAEPSRGVTALELGLRRSLEREPVALGKARLSFEGTSARLEFDP